MKRLRYYLNRITDQRTVNYRYNDVAEGKPVQKEIYDGECIVVYVKPNGEVDGNGDRTGIRREPTFWQNGIGYTFDRTHKLALHRPTVTVHIPVGMLGINDCTVAAADECLRQMTPFFEGINAEYFNRTRPDRDNGKFILYDPGQKVLARNAAYFAEVCVPDYTEGKGNTIFVCVYIDPPPDVLCLCVRMEIQLPYLKLDRAKTMLLKQLPETTERFVREFDKQGLKAALRLEQTQNAIRVFLRENGYCAFIADGSALAREKGSDKPAKGSVPFQSPPGDRIEIAGVKGMGIKDGVTVITGGGYSGKSTVLNAVSAGIYNHVRGDGRELCIANETAVTTTAEDGRAVTDVNISPFIKWLPNGDPKRFSTTHASGSTSQGANIMEAVSLGAGLLLIDEDRSATNFMIRDKVMKALIEKEPIIPFTDRVRELAENGVSTILVIGGSGEYLGIADRVYMMDEFVMGDATARAKSLAGSSVRGGTEATCPPMEDKLVFRENARKTVNAFSSFPTGTTRERLEVSDTGFIIIGDERIDVRYLHDIATAAQTNTLAFMLRHLSSKNTDINELEAIALAMRGLTPKKSGKNEIDICKEADNLFARIGKEGFGVIDTGFFTEMNRFMDMPRRFELLAAVYRMRGSGG
ncbi:MAG: ABC-ATPase domain-containing protein [Defluviitaleaceae bacterium]|nr:ABC-ATPase domain-containing protein [Defluviitaleaceae bacterium]